MPRASFLVPSSKKLYSMALDVRNNTDGSVLFCPIGGDSKHGHANKFEESLRDAGVDYSRFDLSDHGYKWENESEGRGYRVVRSSKGGLREVVASDNPNHILLFDNIIESGRTMLGAYIFALNRLEGLDNSDSDIMSAVIKDTLGVTNFCYEPLYIKLVRDYSGINELMKELLPETYKNLSERELLGLISDAHPQKPKKRRNIKLSSLFRRKKQPEYLEIFSRNLML